MVDFFSLYRDESIIENGKKICEKLLLEGLIVTMSPYTIPQVKRVETRGYSIPRCGTLNLSSENRKLSRSLISVLPGFAWVNLYIAIEIE